MIETKSALDLLRKFFQTVKLFRMYGGDHPQTQEHLKTIEGAIASHLSGEESIRIVSQGNTLLVQDALLPEKDQAVSFLAEGLRARSITSLSFQRGVPQHEIVQVVKILAGRPEEVLEGGNLKEYVQHWFKKVSFNKIRYVVVNESEAVVPAGTAPGAGGPGSALNRSIEGLATALERVGFSGEEPPGGAGPSKAPSGEERQPLRPALPRTTPELLDYVARRVVPGMTSAWEQLQGILGQMPQSVRDLAGTATRSAMRAAIVSRQIQSDLDLELVRKTFRQLAPERDEAIAVFDALAQTLQRAGKVLSADSVRKLMGFLPQLDEIEELSRGQVLVVESNPERCAALKAALVELTFTVDTASTAKEAIEKIEAKKDLDAIVLQLDLPDKRGSVVLSHIHGSRRVVPAVIIPTAGQEVSADARDFELFSYPRKQTIPSDDPKVIARAVVDFAKKGGKEEEEEIRIADLEEARKVQRKLVPAAMPRLEGWELEFLHQPASELGGDLLDVLEVGAESVGIILGEASGRGIAAALVMVMVRSAFRLSVSGEVTPSELVAGVNRMIASKMRPGMVLRLIYACVHLPSGRASVVNCGQNPPALFNPSDGSVQGPLAQGLALGMASVEEFESNLKEEDLDVPPGGQLLFYGDGVIGTLNQKCERFTQRRIYEAVKRAGAGSARALLHDLQASLAAHRGPAAPSLSDDTSMIAVRRCPRG